MKYVILVLTAVLFFFAGRLSVHRGAVFHSEPMKAPGCDELKRFSADFEDYQNLRDPTLRCQKSDQLLNKIMSVFLEDLGLRVTNMVPADQAAPPAEDLSASTPAPVTPPPAKVAPSVAPGTEPAGNP